MEQKNISDKMKDIKSQSLSKLVELQLEQMINSGELQPGERINESLLSNSLQISRAPIREACRQLAQYGMVENHVGKGSFVRKVNLLEAIELYEIRGVLDALAAENACHHANPNDIAELTKLMEQMRRYAKKKATTDYFTTNLKFHKMIVHLSSNTSLIELYEVVFRKISLFRQMTLMQPLRLQLSLSEHEGIVAAVQEKETKRAGKLARAHVEQAKQILLAELS